MREWCFEVGGWPGYCTGIRDTPHRAGGDDDHAGLGLYELVAQQVGQVVLCYSTPEGCQPEFLCALIKRRGVGWAP